MDIVNFEALARLLIVIGMTGGMVLGLRLLWVGFWRIGRRPDRDVASITSGEMSAGTAELRDVVQRLSGEVAELQERVDFAERLLARQRDANQLKG